MCIILRTRCISFSKGEIKDTIMEKGRAEFKKMKTANQKIIESQKEKTNENIYYFILYIKKRVLNSIIKFML